MNDPAPAILAEVKRLVDAGRLGPTTQALVEGEQCRRPRPVR